MFSSRSCGPGECRENIVKFRDLSHRISLAELDFSVLTHDKNCPFTGAGKWPLFAQYTVFPAHLTVRPKITTYWIIERANFSLPGGRVHNRVNANAHQFRPARQQLLPLHLIIHHLAVANRLPIKRIERKHQALPADALGQMESLLHPANQSRQVEIRRYFSGL